MRVLHVTYAWWPDPVGGTEVYVRRLCAALESEGVENLVAAPGAGDQPAPADRPVHWFPDKAPGAGLAALYGDGLAPAAERFGEILRKVRPDVVHQHALSPAASVRLARAVRHAGIPLVFTYHTPAVSCQRGALLEMGARVCDGRLDVGRCTRCVLDQHGAPAWAGQAASRLPPVVGRAARAWWAGGRATTALQMPQLMQLRHARLGEFLNLADRVVVLADWVDDVLTGLGVPSSKRVRSAHGVPLDGAAGATAPGVARPGPLRMAHLGRIDPTKGTALLLEALRRIPDAPVALDLFAASPVGPAAGYGATVKQASSADPRVTWRPSLPEESVIGVLRAYDVVVVPSQWLETGPLVVLESFAAGVPVMASGVGNLRVLVTHGRDGWLLDRYTEPASWAEAVEAWSADRGIAARLRAGVRPPRTMAAVAREMAALYRDVAHARAGTARDGAESRV
jgi:glycosyltransferase involved in cell wall biosynthesis